MVANKKEIIKLDNILLGELLEIKCVEENIIFLLSNLIEKYNSSCDFFRLKNMSERLQKFTQSNVWLFDQYRIHNEILKQINQIINQLIKSKEHAESTTEGNKT